MIHNYMLNCNATYDKAKKISPKIEIKCIKRKFKSAPHFAFVHYPNS